MWRFIEARRQHTCAECRGTIHVGESYLYNGRLCYCTHCEHLDKRETTTTSDSDG